MLAFVIFAALTSQALAATNCFGNIDNIHATGTHSGGVSASQSAVRAHATSCNALKSCFEQVGNAHCIEASVIAGLASRESNCGDSLTAAGYGDAGHAYGILQCDLTHSGLHCTGVGARSCEHIEMMVGHLLIPYINRIKTAHSTWRIEDQLRGGIAAYNFGPGNVHTIAGMDQGTTGNDYSMDVIARAQYFKSNYGYS